MKRKLALILAVSMTISMAVFLSACQCVSSQTGDDGTNNILQEDVG